MAPSMCLRGLCVHVYVCVCMCVRETQNRRGCFESPVVPASDIYYASVLERVGSSQAAGVSEVISLCGFYLAIQKLHWSYHC
jgi:hypothetical protein